jgi:hypothetical protein
MLYTIILVLFVNGNHLENRKRNLKKMQFLTYFGI